MRGLMLVIGGFVISGKWNGQLPATMLPGGTVPFLNVENLKP